MRIFSKNVFDCETVVLSYAAVAVLRNKDLAISKQLDELNLIFKQNAAA